MEVKNEEVCRSGIVRLRVVTPVDNSLWLLFLTWIGSYFVPRWLTG